MHARRALALGAVAAVAAAGLAAPGAAAAAAPPAPAATPSDVRHLDPKKTFTPDAELQASAARAPGVRAAAGTTPAVGTKRDWIALDDFNGRLYFKQFTLKAVGDKIEVWVASDVDDVSRGTRFPEGDCRNDTPGTTTVTTAQAKALAREFDTNMFPKESRAFSTPPARDGSGALLDGDFGGAGDKIVTLVDNVRDANFYDFQNNRSYIAGFFFSALNEYVDRNVMTIDAFDWLHRTGADPRDEPTDDICSSRPARPRLYEGTFAHEYQHLLEYYQDPNEVNFINEGLSDYATTLTGYGNARATVSQPGNDGNLQCFLGFGTVKTPYNPNPRDCGGPQNSLTLWGDEGSGAQILADYGNAWSFQLYLADHYGLDLISALHRDGKRQGLDSVQAQLNRFGDYTRAAQVLHDYQTTNLVDRFVGTPGGTVTGAVTKEAVTVGELNSTVNLLNPTAYAKPGAAPNGADYVALRGSGGGFLRGDQLRSVAFTGAQTLPALPLRWTTTTSAPGRAGNATLFSGNESNLDSAAVTRVTVPAGSPTLTYTERHLAEEGYDYAYTVVSTDGGRTYTPLANGNTVDAPLGPALNGDAAAFATQTFDLSAYAGQTVLLGFRYVSDGGVNDGGWYVDDVRVGGTRVSDGSSLAPFKSPTQWRATEVHNWHVRLVGLDKAGHRAHVEVFDGRTSFSASAAQLEALRGFPLVVATVAYDEPTGQVQQYAGYALEVNGTLQPGG